MKKRGLVSFFIFLFCVSSITSFAAQDLPIEVNADSVDFDHEKGVVTGVGHVVVTYQGTTLIADRGSVNMKTKDVHAQGNVQIIQKGRRIIGDTLDYNFEKETGQFQNAVAFYSPWYIKGEKVIRYSKDKYEVKKGFITTCDAPQPHYCLKAQRVDVYPGNKLVAHNVFFFIGKVPIFWLPYYSYSLKESPWSFVPGYSKRWGAFFLTSFNWLQTPHVQSRVRLDYRARHGFGVGVDGEYTLKKSGGGKFKTYFIRDKKRKFIDGIGEDDRYRVSLSHYQPWRYNTTIRGQFHKLSDEDILKDFFYRDSDYALKPPSFFDITHYHSRYTARFYVQKRLNDTFDEVERLPELSLEFRKQRIFKTPFYYTSTNSLSNLSKKFAEFPDRLTERPLTDTSVVADAQDAVRFDTYDEISYPKKYFGWLETNTWFGVRQTWYSRDLTQSDSLWRGTFTDGVEVGTKFHRIYGYENPKWDIHDLRHVIEPRVKYSYIHDPTVAPSRLIQFDQIDALKRQNTIRPSLRNKLQTKRDNQVWDLIDFLTYVDYFVRPESGQKPFSNIFGDLDLRPLRNFSTDFQVSYDQYNDRVSIFNMDLSTFREGKWRLSTGVRFLDHQSAQWTYGIDYTINSDWAVKVINRWEFETSELQDQEYSIYHNLHCWNSALSFRKTGDDVQVWITFWLNAYPKMSINLGS